MKFDQGDFLAGLKNFVGVPNSRRISWVFSALKSKTARPRREKKRQKNEKQVPRA